MILNNMIVEIYDKNHTLVHRRRNAAPDYSPNRSEWPVVTVGGEMGISQEFYVWLSDYFYGTPYPGIYYLKIFLEIGDNTFVESEPFEFTVNR